MKYLISRAEFIIGNERKSIRFILKTDNIENTRKELHKTMLCDRILFTYSEIIKYKRWEK